MRVPVCQGAVGLDRCDDADREARSPTVVRVNAVIVRAATRERSPSRARWCGTSASRVSSNHRPQSHGVEAVPADHQREQLGVFVPTHLHDAPVGEQQAEALHGLDHPGPADVAPGVRSRKLRAGYRHLTRSAWQWVTTAR